MVSREGEEAEARPDGGALADEEAAMVALYRKLNPAGQALVRQLGETMLERIRAGGAG
jgi:hypothetical protein